MDFDQNRNYWSAAGPAVALAVERKHYFKELIELCASIPRDEVFYILSMELCRWLDNGESVETFIEWVSCSTAGTMEDKAIILDKLQVGSLLRFYDSMVQLGAILGSVCEEYGEQEQTPGWRLVRVLLAIEGIVDLSTCLYNQYPKGFAFHLAVYFYDELATICKTRFALDFFYKIYKGSCYGDAPVTAPATYDNPTESGPAKLSLRQVALLHIYQGAAIPTAADAIARAHGHRSGKRLYELYNKLAHGSNNRTGVEGRALPPMLADISAVIPRLSGPARQQAERELQTLKRENVH